MSDDNSDHHNKETMRKEDAPFRILYVDDEPALAEIAKEYLEDGNPDFEVITTEDPEEALDILENGSVEDERGAEWDGNTGSGTVVTTAGIDCVVSDYSMPEKNGVELLKEVRESYPDLPFILLTGKGSEEVASEAISAGVTDYLRKEAGTDQYKILAKRIENAVSMLRSKEELRETSRRFRAVLDTVEASVFMKDTEGRYIMMNENCRDMLGVGEEGVVGATDYDLFPENVAESYRADDKRVLEEGETVEAQEAVPCSDGERTHLTLKSPIFDEDGEPYAVCGVSTDITERKQRERELKRYEAIVESTSDLVTLVDEDGTILYQSSSTQRVLGYDHEDAVGDNIFEYVHIDDRGKLMGEFSELLEDPEYDIGDAEYRFRHVDGGAVWLSSSITDRTDTELGGFLIVSRDVTERKQKENETRRLKERLDLAIEGAELAVWDWDIEQDAVIYNDRWAEILGMSQEDTVYDIGFREEYAHPEDLPEVNEMLEEHVAGDTERFEAEYRMRTADDDWKWIRTVGQAVERREDGRAKRVVGVHMDIDDRKKRENDLRKTKERLNLAVEAGTLGVWDRDIEAGEVTYNDQWLEMLGLSHEEAEADLGFWEERSHPEDVSRVKQSLKEQFKGETERYDLEHRMRTAEGGWKWLRSVGQVVERDEDGRAKRTVGIHMDIDDRKEREEELERYETFVEKSSDVLTHIDEDGTVLYQSPSVENVFGYEYGETVGDTVFEYAHPEDREMIAEEFDAILTDPERTTGELEYRVRRADGNYVWVEAVGTDHRETDVGGFVVNLRDITERKENEREMRRLNERLDLAIDGADLGVWDWDIKEDEVTYNDEWAEILGISPEEADSASATELWADRIRPDDVEQTNEQLKKHLRGETERYDAEYRIRTADDDWKWIHSLGHVVERDDDGRAQRAVGVHIDTDERKEREEELERYETFIENSSDVVTHLDEDGTILYQSPSTERVLGHDPDERVGENGFEYIHPDDREEALGAFERLSEDSVETIENLEIRYECADGDYVWLDTTGSDQRDTEVGGFVANSREITERKEYENKLERSQDLLRRTERIANTGGWEADFGTGGMRWTKGMYELFDMPDGYEPTIEGSIASYHPEDRDTVRNAMRGCREDGEPFDEELRVVPEDEVVWVHVHGEPVREDGDVVGMRGSVRDITGIKQGQKELERSQDLLRRAEEISDTGGWELDTETGELRWTEGTYRIHGLDEDYEPTVEKAISFYHPEDRDVIEYAVERCREEGEPYDEELRLVTADDEVIWVRSNGEPVYENGEVAGLRGTVRDVTDRKRRETELMSNNKVIRELYEITSDPDLSFEDKVEMVLESCRSRLDLGYAFVTEIDEEKGEQTVAHARGSHELLQPGDSCPLDESYCRKTLGDGFLTVHRASEEGWEGDAAYERFDLGCYVGAELTVGGETHGTICFADEEPRNQEFTDFERTLVELMANWVSYELERKSSKERLRLQKERLDDFASVVSHDLRSPLSVFMGNLELAEETGDSEYFERCRGAVDRMESIIDDLLSLARDVDETGEPEPVPLADIADECWRNTDADTQDAKLRVEAEGVVMADKGKLRQMLDNLFRNAVEHGGEDVTVTVSDLSDGDGFRIEDDGEGIPEEERERVLEAGYTTGEEGTGLGTYIVGQVAEAHGWDLTVTEGEEGGAAFEVEGVERDRDRDRDRIET